jgi:endonuclease/exonuclease/phosphatase (EEP) superfamily protein YafD
MHKPHLITIVTITAALTSGCGALIGSQHFGGAEPLASHDLPIASEVPACLNRLGNGDDKAAPELDSDRIRLVSWNVKKGLSPLWHEDFSALSADQDLVLVQEAVWHPDSSFGEHHWAFAPGYRNGKLLSGVMTYSHSEPLAQCNLISWEPWLGTPKATNITEYGLTGTDQTMLVVNIHAINFTLGVAAFRKQLEQIRPVLAGHPGPIILSGDFNTWRKKRADILETFADEFGLESVDFADDHRKVFFGQPLDHIYVRGLQIGASDTPQLESSDHNPLLVEFSL